MFSGGFNYYCVPLSYTSPDMGWKHRVIILLERAYLHNKIARNWCKFSLPEWPTSQRDVTRNCALIGQWPKWLGAEREFPGNCSVSYLSFVYGRSLWAELNGGENSLHWKANMLPLFSIMTLWVKNLLSFSSVLKVLRRLIWCNSIQDTRLQFGVAMLHGALKIINVISMIFIASSNKRVASLAPRNKYLSIAVLNVSVLIL